MTADVLNALARRAKKGYARTKEGRSSWLAGTFELASALSEARKKLPSDQEFHAWIGKADLASINKDDRAALVCIGSYRNAAQEYFASNSGDLVVANVRPTHQARLTGFAACETAGGAHVHPSSFRHDGTESIPFAVFERAVPRRWSVSRRCRWICPEIASPEP